MGRQFPIIAASAFLAACMAPAKPSETSPKTTGQALAQIACPHRIAEASAWVNYMPGPNRAPRTLTVDVRFVEPGDTAVMLRSPATTGETLVLEIRTAPAAAVPGHLGYREPVPDPLYKRISFFCRGAEIHSLDQIERVY